MGITENTEVIDFHVVKEITENFSIELGNAGLNVDMSDCKKLTLRGLSLSLIISKSKVTGINTKELLFDHSS